MGRSAAVRIVAIGLNTQVGGQVGLLLSGIAEGMAKAVSDPAGKGPEGRQGSPHRHRKDVELFSHGGDLREDPSSMETTQTHGNR